jgi:DNA-binding NtrC family response regulator
MKILMIDHSGLQVQTRKMFIENAVECVVDVAINHEEVEKFLQNSAYNLVILDHTAKDCQQSAQYIIKHSPMQAILVVSGAPDCIISSCETCIAHHNIKRLSNPTSINNILRLIREFKDVACNHYGKMTNTSTHVN